LCVLVFFFGLRRGGEGGWGGGFWGGGGGGGRLENPARNHRSKARTNNKLNPHMAPDQHPTWATLLGGECSHTAPSLLPSSIKAHAKGEKKARKKRVKTPKKGGSLSAVIRRGH